MDTISNQTNQITKLNETLSVKNEELEEKIEQSNYEKD
jgi:hypothetical protein